MVSDLEDDITTFWQLLFDITIDVERRLVTHITAHDLTPPQFYVLKTLAEHGGRCRIGEIASEHYLTHATMTGIVKRLEATQPALVRRQPGETDGRVVDVVLTEAGEARFLAVQASLLKQVRTVMSLLPADERADIIDRVQKYFRMMTNLFPVNTVSEIADKS